MTVRRFNGSASAIAVTTSGCPGAHTRPARPANADRTTVQPSRVVPAGSPSRKTAGGGGAVAEVSSTVAAQACWATCVAC